MASPPDEDGRDRTHEAEAEPTLDGAFAPDGVDLTVIRWMLDLTPIERLQAAQELVDAAAVARRADED